MASLREKIKIEVENISIVLKELRLTRNRPNKEVVVLAGMGAFLQNIYTGMENILKQVLIHEGKTIPASEQWHKDLLGLSVESHILTKELSEKIGRYLFFRHFFTHSYTFLLNKEKIEPLSSGIDEVFEEFKNEIELYMQKQNA